MRVFYYTDQAKYKENLNSISKVSKHPDKVTLVIGDTSSIVIHLYIPYYCPGWGANMCTVIQRYLIAQGLRPTIIDNSLFLYNKEILSYSSLIQPEYSSNYIFVNKSNPGINDFGITSLELLKVVVESSKKFIKCREENRC